MQANLTAFHSMSLAKQFLIAGGAVTIGAMLSIGLFVTSLISEAVTQNSAAATALYVDSIIAPILPDMTTTEHLDESIERALDETLGQGALGTRLLSFRLWRGDGTVVYSNDKKLMGQQIQPDADLRKAFSGKMVAEFELDHDEDMASAVITTEPILEIYYPILQPWSGEIVAVAEFYERATDLNISLARARWLSWTAVSVVIAAFFLILSLIVFRGSLTIEGQRKALGARVTELNELLLLNQKLGARIKKASQETTALNERFLRRVGADLHDGPVQLVAYASLRVDSPTVRDCFSPAKQRSEEIDRIKDCLDEAMKEIRGICHGLVLPEIETLSLSELLTQAVSNYQNRTRVEVEMVTEDAAWDLSATDKICIYRFIQEALHNGWRHAQGKGQLLEQRYDDETLVISVSDQGDGFDPSTVEPGRLGISGLRERIESLGGTFEISSTKTGTRLTMSLGHSVKV